MGQLSPLPHIDSFINEIDGAGTHAEVFSILEQELKELGFDRYSYELLWPPDGNYRPFWYTNYPGEWSKHYIANRYASHDMICRHSAQMQRPFLWADVTNKLDQKSPAYILMQEASEMGLRAGCNIPIDGPNRAKAYLAVSNGMTDAEFARLFYLRRHELQLLATYVHERVLTVGIPKVTGPISKLSAREIEILTWTALGKTTAEVSIILGVSSTTIKRHMENIFRKLNVYEKTHAAAVAMARGLIAL
jgi:DNA-binding CsgD family transcriptional regulator